MSPPIIFYAIGEKKPEKKFRASMGFKPVTSTNTVIGAMLYQLSYEATHWWVAQLVEHHTGIRGGHGFEYR